ncbi:MAG: trehalose-6-phosphate synthase [Aggregatilineales bacterium]
MAQENGAKTKKTEDDSDKSSPTDKPLIVIASNRGPFSFKQSENGELTHTRGQGGLVTALAGVAEKHDVLWVACALSEADEAWAKQHNDQPQDIDGTTLQLVRVDTDRFNQYYNQIANPLLWFLHHQLWDTPRQPTFDGNLWDAWYDGYVAVNKQIAEVIAESVKDYDGPVVIFPQDYHLYMVPKFLRELLGDKVQIQHFLHIPWPGPDAWRLLPSEIRDAIFTSFLNCDRIGFQTKRDAFNFVQTCRFYLPDAHSYGSRDTIDYEGRKVRAIAYPISIDVEKLETMAASTEIELHKSRVINIVGDRKVILRVDRIEPSKNILRGFQAFRELLERFPEHRGKVQMLALLVPSRLDVKEYFTYLQEVTAEVGLINAQFSDALWEPIRMILGNNYQRAIAAFQIYDILMVNPITDGMNLVAKEGALVNQRDGVLLLSEYAGAFYELGDNALVVSPFDIYKTAQAMHDALKMPMAEREKMATALRKQVQGAGVKAWFNNQLTDALNAFKNQSKKSSTPVTPSTKKSEA